MENHLLLVQSEVVRVASTEELQSHFHQLLTSQFRARKCLEHTLAVFCIQVLPLLDSFNVRVFELEPPVRFHLEQCCCFTGQRGLLTLHKSLFRGISLTHGLVIGPPKWSVGPGQSLVDVELMVRAGQRHTAECGVVGEVSESFDLLSGKLTWSVHGSLGVQIGGCHGQIYFLRRGW